MLPGAVTIYVCSGSLLAIDECLCRKAFLGRVWTIFDRRSSRSVVCQRCCAESTELVLVGSAFYTLMYRAPRAIHHYRFNLTRWVEKLNTFVNTCAT